MQHPGFLTSLLGFLLVLGPLVFLHELGHYLVGRWCGVKADVFSIGFGKELVGWTDKRGTRWKLSLLPLGGYVQFAGDMSPTSKPSVEWLALPAEERNRTFQAKRLWQRALIVLAGPVTNLLVALVILSSFTLAYGKLVVPPVVGVIQPGSVAQAAGMKVGDRIVSLRGAGVDTFMDVKLTVAQHPGEPLDVVVERGGQRLPLRAVAGVKTESDRFGNVQKIGFMGIGPASVQVVRVGPLEAVADGARQMRSIVDMMVTGIVQIVSGQREVKELGGPIKIAKFSGEQLVSGWQPFVFFVALISINLGFINLLPIPVLDGGHLAFYLAEAVRRRPVSARGQEWAFRAGLALVVVLMVVVTVNDVASLDLVRSAGRLLGAKGFGG
jgi:regulator of sigma E protease